MAKELLKKANANNDHHSQFIQIVESGQEKNGALQTLTGKQLNRVNGKLQNEVLVDA